MGPLFIKSCVSLQHSLHAASYPCKELSMYSISNSASIMKVNKEEYKFSWPISNLKFRYKQSVSWSTVPTVKTSFPYFSWSSIGCSYITKTSKCLLNVFFSRFCGVYVHIWPYSLFFKHCMSFEMASIEILLQQVHFRQGNSSSQKMISQISISTSL